MRRRVGRPGLVGTMARTAVVAGTASAVSGNVSRRQAGRAAEKEAAQQYEQQQYAPPPPPQPVAAAPAPAPTGGGDDLMDQLQKLADMKAAGILDDAEFAAAKAKLLG